MVLTHRLGRLAIRAGSGLALLAVVAGVPTGLVSFIGWPLPRRLPTTWHQIAQMLTGGFPDTAVVGLLAVAVWLVWAAFCHALTVEAVAARRGQPARRTRLISPMQALAALLVAGLAAGPAAASTVIPPIAADASHAAATLGPHPAPGGTPAPSRSSTASAAVAGELPASAVAALSGPAGSPGAHRDLPRFAVSNGSGPLTLTTAAGARYTTIVQRGDTLWDLAGAWLGDPHRWPEIYQLNKDRYDAHGRMRGGDHIEPTWHLVLPDDAAPPAGTPPHTFLPPPAAAEPPPPANTGDTPPPPDPPPVTATAPPVASPTIDPGRAQGDDGVLGDPPARATPASTTPAPPAGAATAGAAPAGTPADTPDPAADRSSPPGVSLTGDSWVDLGLVLAITAAAAVVWRLRRRRYTPRPPTAQARLDDPDLVPLPPVVTRLRRGLRVPPDGPDPDDADLVARLGEPSTDMGDEPATAGDTHRTDAEAPGHSGEQNQRHKTGPPLNLPALGNPILAAWPPAGLGLTGPGAEAAARGFLTTALAAGGPDDPHSRATVVLPAATLATLLGAAAVHVPDTPRLTVTGDLTEALELLEEQTLHRTRLVYAHEADTVAGLRQADPHEEPLPPLLLLADTTVDHEKTRIAALLAQGQRLDIHGIMLGPWPDGDTVVVAGDGTTTPAGRQRSRHGSHPADVARLTVINPADTAALLTTLAESHTGQPQPPPPTEPPTATPPAGPPPSPPAESSAATVASHGGRDSEDADTADPDDNTSTESSASDPAGDTAVITGPGQVAGDHPDLDDDAPVDGPRVVAVQVLGPPTIIGADPTQPLRAKAMELLVYLIARDGAATLDAIIEDLVPDATMSKAPGRIHTYIYALRRALRRTGGPATYITHPRHRYCLNRDTLDVDLWRMRDALTDAETSTGPRRVEALQRAVALYRGPLAADTGYEWAEPYREAIRRQALDAHLALADALHDQPEQALAVLNQAIGHDPYAEQLYQAAMRRDADLGDLDAITARHTELTRRLEELDTEPSDHTSDLARTLTDDVRRRIRPTPGAVT